MPTTYSFDEIKQTLTIYDNHGVTDFCEENNLDIAEFGYPTIIAKKVVNCDNLFKGCSKFNHPVTIPSTVKRCNRMFSGCTSLNQTIVIPTTVTKRERMFESCPLMNEDGTPKEVSSAGTYTFDEVTQTLTVHKSAGVKDFCDDYDIPITLFNHKVIIPDSVTDCRQMFGGCKSFNQPITVPKCVKDCSYMFEDCTSFNQPITIPDSVTNCHGMFFGCSSFNQSITLPSSVTKCGTMFDGCKSFNQPIVIPESVLDCTAMFNGCKSLNQAITVPNSVVSRWYMFDECPYMNEDGTPRTTAGTYTFGNFALDVDTFLTVFVKHSNYKEWFNTNFPNGASSKEEVLSKL